MSKLVFNRWQAIALTLAIVMGNAAFAGTIRLNTGSIDTSRTPQLSAKSFLSYGDSGGKSLALVQFSGPIQPEWLDELKQMGISPHFYLPEHAYLVSIDASSLEKVHALKRVAWVGALPNDLKINPQLMGYGKNKKHQLGGKDAENTLEITILSVDAGPEAWLKQKSIAVDTARKSRLGWYDTRASIPRKRLEELAALPGVFYIEPTPQYKMRGERGAQTAAGQYTNGADAPTGPGYMAFLSANGLSGAPGVIVQVQDDGLDKGIATNAPGTAHPDILGRIAGIDNPTGDTLGDSAGGHGQINASIIMGNATVGSVDSDGYLLGQGLAPQAEVYATKIFSNDGFFDIGFDSFTDLAKRAQDAGATYSSNSWGADTFGDYTADSAEFDALTRDADTAESGDQAMCYFFSAGNSGPFSESIGSPGTAKNVITVGAGENSDGDGTDGCGVGPSGADSIMDIINFSSRGPTSDGRFGITLFATGTHVQGAASTSPNYDGTGVCNQYWPTGQTNYARSSGTSHSCPTACGAGLIVQELFSSQLSSMGHPANPSPALVKAVLANTAHDMAGGNDGLGGTLGSVPNTNQGWGSVNLKTLMDQKNALYSIDQTTLFTASAQESSVLLTPLDLGKPLKITLCWTDAPASPLANPLLVNDLDLEVTDGANVYRGNVFSGGFSATGGAADRLNNLESVYIPNPSGPVTVRIIAHNIAGNGVPSQGGSLDQDFALFASNATDQTSAGIAVIQETAARCGGSIHITVSDADLQGDSTALVTVTATSGDSESVTVTETGLNTGVFTATLPVQDASVATNDGTLQASDGNTVTLTYNDADDGSGSSAVVTDTATMDCVAPVISNVQVSNVTHSAATVTFTTSEAAAGSAQFGLACGSLTESRSGSSGITSHTIYLTGLLSSTDYFLAVSASDIAGNTISEDSGGSCFTFTTLVEPGSCPNSIISNGSFESGDFAGWTAAEGSGSSLQSWTVTTGGTGWFGNGTPYGGDYWAQNGFDGSAGMTYDLYREVAIPASSPIVEVSWAERIQWDLYSYGATQDRSYVVTVQPAGGGTPIATLFTADLEAGTIGDTGWVPHTADLLSLAPSVAGQTVRINWHQFIPEGFSGPAQFDIDGVCVVVPPQSSAGTVTLSGDRFSCDSSMNVTVSDTDLQGAGSINVTVASTRGDSELVTLLESPAGSGFLSAALNLADQAPATNDGTLQVAHGNTITATYADADDGSGSSAVASDTATVDCQVPVISNVVVSGITGRAATITFTTDEAATGRIDYGTSCGALGSSVDSSMALVSHQFALSGLTSNTTYYFEASAEDIAGNTTTNTNGGACFSFTTLDIPDYFTEQFSSGHSFDLGFRSLMFEPDGSSSYYHACSESAGTLPVDPSGGTSLSLSDDDNETVLLTGGKQVSLYGSSYGNLYVGSNGFITFGTPDNNPFESYEDHFQLPRISALFDDLLPDGNTTVSWRQLSDRAVVTWLNIAEYSGSQDNTFQIEMFFDGRIRITYGLIGAIDGIAGLSRGTGLPVDFIASNLSELAACLSSDGAITFDADSVACGGTLGLSLGDLDLAGFGTATVTVQSTSGESETLSLVEDAQFPGEFHGTIQLASTPTAPSDNSIFALNGAVLTASYQDLDNGSGGSATKTDTASVDCTAPVLVNVSVADVRATNATIQIVTNEVTNAEVEFGLSCGTAASSAQSDSPGSSHNVVLTNLAPDTTYFFRVHATDLAGNVASNDNSGACFSFRTDDEEDFATEVFVGGADSLDLDYQQILLTPSLGGASYDVCITPISELPSDPLQGTNLLLEDDEVIPLSLSGQTFPFYGTPYTSAYLSSNGFVTFGLPDSTVVGTITTHFNFERIAALMEDLDPSFSGSVRFAMYTDRVAITWLDVPEWGGTTAPNTVQMELYFDGRIALSYLDISIAYGIVGISAGYGVPSGFVESDFSASEICNIVRPRLVGHALREVGDELFLHVIYPHADLATTYSWIRDGQPIPDLYENALYIDSVDYDDSGEYYVILDTGSKTLLESNHVNVLVVDSVPSSGPIALVLLGGALALFFVMRRRTSRTG